MVIVLSHFRHLYISTVDGILSAISEQGEIIWSYSTQEPLFTSSLSHGEVYMI